MPILQEVYIVNVSHTSFRTARLLQVFSAALDVAEWPHLCLYFFRKKCLFTKMWR